METLYIFIANHLPQRVVFHAFLRFWAHATTYKEGSSMTPTEMTWRKAIELWEDKYGR